MAKQHMEEQQVEMQSIGDVVDKVMGHVEKLIAFFIRLMRKDRGQML